MITLLYLGQDGGFFPYSQLAKLEVVLFKGSLFTGEFLIDGIREYDEWRNLQSEDLDEFQNKLKDIFAKFPTTGNPLESTTGKDLIIWKEEPDAL